ncbi:hypothetical protein [Verrucomicrobium sp. BvORR106]|uniref:hypothetical protein n=1 Tax=Verrucomicrobium sp. BvORR106 TaxID=1403819 RepID=UPI002240FBA3|nr:hypothetical protein [Verrucomicrobium sp. BvORR106]
MKLEPPNPTPIPKNRALLIGVILAILFAFIATIVTWGVLWTHGHDEAEKAVQPAGAQR